ncbi:hypothetical protein DPV73_01420 [Leptospira mayottensis]|nr:hypothetical protein DPV73_01420 [Leptospira mayottensis]
MSVGISERGGTSVDVGLTKGGFNAGLNYNSKTGSVSGNAGFTSQNGTGLALSYNEGDGFGASLSKSFSNGVNGGISWSEKGGVGGNIGYEAPGDKDKPKNSLANQMKGAGGTLSFNQRDGVSAALNASGGVNAGNWSESGGFQANTNFLADKWKADFISGKAKEDADAQEASRGAQNRNNQESGAAAIAGMGVETQRREEDGILDHILGKAAETLGGGLDWVGNKIDGAIDSVVGVASSAWDGAKNAFGFGKGESLSMKPLHHENAGDGAAYGASDSTESASDRHLRVGEEAISNHLDKQRSENPYLQKGEVDVSMNSKYHKKLINMEIESGVSGGNLVLNKETGKLYYRTEATGADSKLIPTNPNERVKSPWTQVEMHTDNLNGITSGDYHAPKGSAQSVWGPEGGTFKITNIKTMRLGGNEITTRTVINGKEIIENHRHVMNEMPDVAYNAFKKGTSLPYGTPIGYTGITGNMAVSINNDKNSPRFGMLSAPAYHMHTNVKNAETHSGFIQGVTFGPEVRQSQGLPAFDYTSHYKKKALDLLTGGN